MIALPDISRDTENLVINPTLSPSRMNQNELNSIVSQVAMEEEGTVAEEAVTEATVRIKLTYQIDI